jgi:hypothetical protein
MVEIYNAPAAKSKGPEAIVTRYAPLCFFLIGLTYAAACLLAFHTFAIHHQTDLTSVIRVWLVGISLMFSIPSLAYRATESSRKQ